MPDAASTSSSSDDSTAYVYDRHGGPPVHRTVEHEALHAIFSSFDRNRSGSIDRDELRAGLVRLGHSVDGAMLTQIMAACDTHEDGHISYEAFIRYATQRERELREAFELIDSDGSGRINAVEIRAALHKLGVETADDASIRQLVKRMAATNAHSGGAYHAPRLGKKPSGERAHEISFQQFRQFCVLLPATNTMQLFEYFEGNLGIDIGEGSAIPDDRRDVAVPPWVTLAAGAVAGVASRTATAPMDRTKTMLQAGMGGGSVRAAVSTIFAEGGAIAFFRGNSANCVKIAPESAIKFFAYERTKLLVCRDASAPTMLERFVSGGTAGAIAQTVIYPLETAKTRLALNSEYHGIWDCLSRTAAAEGPAALFRGLGASLLGVVPYAGTDLMIYNALKNAYAERHPGREPSTLTFLACGAVSSTIGQAVAYPLQVVRTRLQAQGLPGMPAYDGVVDCLRRTVADGGVRALYNGFLPNFAKALPAISISYAVFEKTKRLLLGKRRGLADGTS